MTSLHPLEKEVKAAIERNAPDGGRMLVAFSGGADSTALLAALTALGHECVAAHCNFGLRGSESDRDQLMAEKMSRQLGATWTSTRFDTAAYCARHGVSTEMGCRELRYEWFDTIAREMMCSHIAVGHNADDNAETFILNLMRRTGLQGLTGIKAIRRNIVRPLLRVPRATIIDYLTERHLSWVEDSSNLTDDYARNRVRHHVMPALQASFPDAREAMARVSENLDEDYRLLASLLPPVTDSVDIAAIKSHPMAEAMLFHMLKPHGFNRSATDAILCSGTGSRFTTAKGDTWLLDRGTLRQYLASGIPSQGIEALTIDIIGHDEFHPSRGARELYLDATALEGNPRWELRQWRQGDRIAPYGMKGTRLVSDILSDAHVALDRKGLTMVLTRNDVILWVVGHRTSSHFTVTESTTKIARVRIN